MATPAPFQECTPCNKFAAPFTHTPVHVKSKIIMSETMLSSPLIIIPVEPDPSRPVFPLTHFV